MLITMLTALLKMLVSKYVGAQGSGALLPEAQFAL